MLYPDFAAKPLVDERPRVLRRGRHVAVDDGLCFMDLGRRREHHGFSIAEGTGPEDQLETCQAVICSPRAFSLTTPVLFRKLPGPHTAMTRFKSLLRCALEEAG